MRLITLLILSFSFFLLDAQLTTSDISFGDLRARSIGPATMSGRVSTLDAVSSSPEILYVGAAGGGIWKSISAGASFRPVFDDHNQSIGDIAIDQSHPDTVWVGTGEPWVRNSVSVGDGIYVSTNAGTSWTHKGLPASEHISKVLVHPDNSSVIYVAVQGRLWSQSEERGVYKSTDFGTTWEKVLYIDEGTGAADLTMDMQNPNVLYAAMWEHQRYPDYFNSGGPGSGIYKSENGGETWTKLTNDIPKGDLGRIAIEVAPTDGNIVYATIECEEKEEKGLYKSEDAGASWSLVNTDFGMTVRPFYFSRLYIDPTDADIVYKCGLNAVISNDGGEKFRTIESGVHSDIHDIWVNPHNNKHVLLGTDGGVYRSLDGATLFEHFRNLPISQFYQISVDSDTPYKVYGGLQDNGSWYAPSRTKTGGIRNSDWNLSFYGDGFYSFRHPTDPDIIYSESQGGNVARYNRRDGQTKNIAPIAEGDDKLRYNWNTPIHLSEHQPDRVYVGAQYLYRSEDKGDSWTKISGDLTTNNPDRQRQAKSGGLSIDNSTAENNTTIYIIEESRIDDQVIWVGTDDGLVHVTKDGGSSWSDVTSTIPDLPAGLWVSSIQASRDDRNTAYVTIDGHRSGDQEVYVYKTTDAGASWSDISEGIEGYAHVIKEDLENPNLLYVGTEYGLYISVDGGASWKRFSSNLPKVAVHDLALPITEDDLVIGTHGRGVYILDYLSPLRQLNDGMVEETLSFFEGEPVVVKNPALGQPFTGAGEFVGANPSSAAFITYYMKKRHVFGKMSIDVFDQDDNLITTLPAGKSKGINIVSLPIRLPPPKAAPTRNRMALFGSMTTPALNQGTYKVVVRKGKQEYTTDLTLLDDPSGGYTTAGIAKQKEISTQLYDMTNQLGHIYKNLDEVHTQISDMHEAGDLKDETSKKLAEEVEKYKNSLVSLEGDFYVAEGEANIREDISTLGLSVGQYPGMPSQGQIRKAKELAERMSKIADKASSFMSQLDTINKGLSAAGKKEISLTSLEDYLEN